MATTVGVDVGGTKMLAVRVVDGEVAAEARAATPAAGPASPAVVAAIREVWHPDVAAVGVGIAGLVDAAAGVFVWGPHVAGTDVWVRSFLEAELGVPAIVDNDANTAAWGEYVAGSGLGLRHMLLVTVGTGIGGAVIADGALYRGRAFAGEWGHMAVDPGGVPCACGRRGCWETIVSGPALARLAEESVVADPRGEFAARFGPGDIDPEAVSRAAADGEEEAAALVAEVGRALGRGLAVLTVAFDPEAVVVGGGLGSVGESLLAPAREEMAATMPGTAHRPLPSIATARLGASAGAVGAAMLATHMAGGSGT
jgi:glucokinase